MRSDAAISYYEMLFKRPKVRLGQIAALVASLAMTGVAAFRNVIEGSPERRRTNLRTVIARSFEGDSLRRDAAI